MLDQYKIKMLAIQYKRLGFTNKQIAETFNKQGFVTPHKKKPYTEQTISKLTAGVNNQQGNKK